MNRENSKEIAKFISSKLNDELPNLKQQYLSSEDRIGFFYIDDILPKDLADKCFKVFPEKSDMRQLKSIREYKYVKIPLLTPSTWHACLSDMVNVA